VRCEAGVFTALFHRATFPVSESYVKRAQLSGARDFA
jgi:hypothetical protein